MKISFFRKGETFFHLLSQQSAPGGNLTMRFPFLHPPKKAFLSLSAWIRKEYTLTLI